MNKSAVVCFSRTNTTEHIANLLAEGMQSRMFSLESNYYPPGPLGYMRGIWRAVNKKEDPIHTESWGIFKYDLLVVGSPIWASNLTPPVRTFLKNYGRQAKEVAFFLTCGGSGANFVFEQMEELCGKAPLVNLEIRAQDLKDGQYKVKVKYFLEEIEEKRTSLLSRAV